VKKTLAFDWEKYGFVIASDYRRKIVVCLLDGPKTPKQLATETGLYLSHVSKTLKELSDIEMVECLTHELRRGKVYAVKNEGKEVAEKVKIQKIQKTRS